MTYRSALSEKPESDKQLPIQIAPIAEHLKNDAYKQQGEQARYRSA